MLSLREGTIGSRFIAMATAIPAESQTLACVDTFGAGTGRSLMLADGDKLKAPAGKAVGRNPVGRKTEKSDEG